MEVAHKKHEEQVQLEIQEENYNITKNSDVYLRKEIELLELDKKRLELQLAIDESRKALSESER
jgi:transcriptional antiterminator Rof (Rho-off)